MANSWLSSGIMMLLVREHPRPHLLVEREADDAVSDGEHEDGRRAVDREAGGDLSRAGLEKRRGVRRADSCGGHLNTEKIVPTEMFTSRLDEPSSGSYRSRNSPRGIAVRNLIGLGHFLRNHRGELTAPLVRIDEHFVRDHVELLLRFSLHVVLSDGIADAAERTFAHAIADRLACARDHFDQEPQLGRDLPVMPLLLDQVLGESDAAHAASIRPE